MRKMTGWTIALTLASALAMSATASAQLQNRNARPAFHAGSHVPGGGAQRSFAPRFSGHRGTPHFTQRHVSPRVGTRRVTPHYSTRSFSRHAGQRSINRRFTGTPGINATRGSSSGFSRSVQRARRPSGTVGLASPSFRTGRFGTHFAGRRHGPHYANIAAHRAWRRGYRAGFVPWFGPVFWPYAYSDIFDYAFWPNGYDDGFWYYAYDDFFDGLFWGDVAPADDYAAADLSLPRVTYAGVQELCTQPGTGITAWPFAAMERKLGLNAEQKQLLGDVRKAASDAAATFKASCPSKDAFPLTPPGRLTAMTARLQGTLDAVKIVQPALDKFYASLSDEQKERFNQLGPKRSVNNAEAGAALPADAKSCATAKPGLSTLPIERISAAVKPTDAQQDSLKQLQAATEKAVSLLQAACPQDTPLTPTGRLAAMEKRLQAMIDAANTVKPALNNFYASLTDEQKARFDRIGGELAQNNG